MALPPGDGGGDDVEGARARTDERDTDAEIVLQVARGDENAFRRLFRRYAPLANALAIRVLRQPFLAEEAVQDAFLAAWQGAGSFDPHRGSVRGWLMGLVHNRAVDLVRREESQRRRAEASSAEAAVVVVVDDPADDVVGTMGSVEESSRLRSALRDLPEQQRHVIELMYFEGMTQSAIAKRLSIPLGTVKSRTLLGMRRLRTGLAEMER
jgi:RNA polymerase sigma-70 factor (ECF subfamily)